jgi:hypothetical protein
MLINNKTHFMKIPEIINLIANQPEKQTTTVLCINITQNIKFILIKILTMNTLRIINIF